jgi:exopolyphosphatase/guanosine-5'-triphosphate,3'-diphosphate pyrophosphatase
MNHRLSSNLAAIDAGSNGIRMIVARLNTDGKLETLENIRLPVRLGQDAFTTGRFSEGTMQLAVEAFLRFRQIADLFKVDRARAVGTSAMREAENAELLIDRIYRETGFMIEVISGEEEARLIHLAVKHAVDLQDKISLLIDIGGGSVEVTLSDGENILSTESLGIGTVRLLSRLAEQNDHKLPLDHLLREYAASARRYVENEISGRKIQICLGTGGNLEEMGKLRKRLFKKQRSELISSDDLERLIGYLGGMSYEDRVENLDLNPDRADVILPAMIVVQMIIHEANIDRVLIPNVGLKDGVLLEMAPLALGPRLPRRVQVMASVEQMGGKYAYDAEHAAIVARLAARLFNQSLSLHQLTENEGLLLEAAAMLHDVGHFINAIDHDRHGYYLLMHHPLIGLTDAEQEVVANLVCYHRKKTPTQSDENFKNLSQKDRTVVTKLVALLRLADALDMSHMARVLDVFLEQDQNRVWRLHLISQSEAMLEKWALAKRKTLFEELFGVKLEVA